MYCQVLIAEMSKFSASFFLYPPPVPPRYPSPKYGIWSFHFTAFWHSLAKAPIRMAVQQRHSRPLNCNPLGLLESLTLFNLRKVITKTHYRFISWNQSKDQWLNSLELIDFFSKKVGLAFFHEANPPRKTASIPSSSQPGSAENPNLESPIKSSMNFHATVSFLSDYCYAT